MKPKMQGPISHPNRQAFEEIREFLRAVESYPERVAKEPTITFRRHLSSLIAAPEDDAPRRH
ncbi:MAG TPA: hypothetical protein VN901_29510 [Candidatus Acidoferrales bacterium]|nr:hypothetical protein [Candidatus Acidoferrales bacterium]